MRQKLSGWLLLLATRFADLNKCFYDSGVKFDTCPFG